MYKNRPVNLDISTIHIPLPAVASILHRTSVITLFFGALLMMYTLGLSLESAAGFQETSMLFEESFFAKLLAWGLLSALAFYSVDAVKHLFMDANYIENLGSGFWLSAVYRSLSALLVVLAGIWVW